MAAEEVAAADAAAVLCERVLGLLLGGAPASDPLGVAEPGPRPVVVGLDGRSGSGKTTLARRLTRELREAGATVIVLHLDHVYPGWDGLAEASRLLGEDLLPLLRAGRPATYCAWSWVRDAPGPPMTVRPADVLVVEGVGCGSRACRRGTDLLVWLDAPTRVRRERAMARDGDAYAPHWQRWAAQEERYLLDERPENAADVVVRTA